MSKFLVAALLLSLVNHGAMAWEDKDFFRSCPPYKCGKHGPEIRFPFRLESSNTSSSCGRPCKNRKLACSGQDTILVYPVFGPCKVITIDYRLASMNILPLVYSLSPCPLQKLFSRSFPRPSSTEVAVVVENYPGPCDKYNDYYATLVCCSKEFTPRIRDADSIVGPISCLSNATHFSYLVDAYGPISILPSDCTVCSNGTVPIPRDYSMQISFKESAERILSFAEITLPWEDPMQEMDKGINCPECERRRGHCAFSSQRNQTFCMHHGIVSVKNTI